MARKPRQTQASKAETAKAAAAVQDTAGAATAETGQTEAPTSTAATQPGAAAPPDLSGEGGKVEGEAVRPVSPSTEAVTPKGRSGTAREASSAGSGPEAAVAAAAEGGVQPAAPSFLVVRGPKAGRWRAGRYFHAAEPVRIPLDDLSDEQRAAIRDDPELIVTEEAATS